MEIGSHKFGSLNLAKYPELATCHLNKVTEEWKEIFEELAKEGWSFLNNIDVSMLFS